VLNKGGHPRSLHLLSKERLVWYEHRIKVRGNDYEYIQAFILFIESTERTSTYPLSLTETLPATSLSEMKKSTGRECKGLEVVAVP
jgi:hypothetical protein